MFKWEKTFQEVVETKDKAKSELEKIENFKSQITFFCINHLNV